MSSPLIVLTGGGTAGHVTPNLALLSSLRTEGFEVHYVGRHAGIERELAEAAGVPYHGIRAGKLRRYLDWENLVDVFRTMAGTVSALSLLMRLKPRVVFSKGGFVSCPVVWAAWLLRVPVVAHESDITPGLANRLAIPFVKKVCCAFPEAAAKLGAKGVVTGLPVRAALLGGDAEAGRRLCGFSAEKPVVTVLGGSQGAVAVNDAVRGALPQLLERYQVCHLCGPGNLLEGDLPGGYWQTEYAREELADLLAMTSVAVSRAGATTLFELLALHIPSVLVPLPLSASRGDQILNAHSFEHQGYALVLAQEDMTGEALLAGVDTAVERGEEMRRAMQTSGASDSVEAVLSVIRRLSRPVPRG